MAKGLEAPRSDARIDPVSKRELVRAGGGLLWRRHGGRPEIALVHRPAYDDWSLPKGKASGGEDDATCALREVEEETGVRALLGEHAGTVEYDDREGRPKIVHYWRMTVQHDPGPPAPNDEVDEVRWAELDDALDVLTYDHDVELVRALRDDLAKQVSVYLVRHARAGHRTTEGDDRARSLTKGGHAQAEGLAVLLGDRDIERIVTSPYTRCVETVAPLAAAIGVEIETSEALAEGAPLVDAWRLVETATVTTALCSHGDVIGDLVHTVFRHGVEIPSDRIEKGSTWLLRTEHGEVFKARYLAPPS
jgi:8-oxo-dGTP diphosphatase